MEQHNVLYSMEYQNYWTNYDFLKNNFLQTKSTSSIDWVQLRYNDIFYVHSISNELAKSESLEDTRLKSKAKIIQDSIGNVYYSVLIWKVIFFRFFLIQSQHVSSNVFWFYQQDCTDKLCHLKIEKYFIIISSN